MQCHAIRTAPSISCEAHTCAAPRAPRALGAQITQQALWGRALDDCAVGGGRQISYQRVVGEGLSKEGMAAFFTPSKWFSRVLMNAPAQGTIPWFYNQVLPVGERPFLRLVQAIRGNDPVL